MRMESSEEEDDFPSIESVTPQSKIDTLYQSKTEKGIRKICFELLDLKDAVENLCGNTHTKYSAFLSGASVEIMLPREAAFQWLETEEQGPRLLVKGKSQEGKENSSSHKQGRTGKREKLETRLCEEVVETEHELNDIQKHISAQRILVQDLMNGVCRELGEWTQVSDSIEEGESLHINELDSSEEADYRTIFLEKIDVLLAEHKMDEVIELIDIEEKSHPELKTSGDSLSTFRSALLKRKAMLENQLVEITKQPSIGIGEIKKALSALLKLGKGPLAHQLLLKSYGSRLHKSIEGFLPLCPCYPETYSATLSNLLFSSISLTTKESAAMFGDNPVYSNRIVQWAEWEIESFVRLVKEHAPPSDTASALRAASVCVQASLNHCSALEAQGLNLSKLLLVLLRPYVEEVLELNFRRARKMILDFSGSDETIPLSPRFASPLSTFATSSDSLLVESGMRFIFITKDIVEQLTYLVIQHFGGNILIRISQLFDNYVDALIKALSCPSDDDNLIELKEAVPFRAETDSQQLALLGTAFTIAEELLPMVVSRIWNILNESKEAGNGPESMMPSANNNLEFKDWRRHLQHSLDKLRDYFCRQYVLSFIYSRDDKTQLDAHIYLHGREEDLLWGSDPLPSLPFQALFGKLQKLATVAGDVLLGREKIQKVLLARLTETVVMWLSDEQEFWVVLEDGSTPLRPLGLQQLILDMHFTVEIARFAGYPSRHVHQIASAIIARAIRAFSARGVDPQSALPEDEWFVETAKGAINKLLHVASGSDTSDIDEEHIMLHDEAMSDSDASPSSLSSVESTESFASAEMGDLESPMFSDAES